MPEVTIEVAGRPYRVGCGEGEEEHLRDLALRLDTEAQKLSRGTAAVPEARLLLMTALVIADRLWEAQREIRALEQRIEQGEAVAVPNGVDGAEREAALVDEIEALAARVEALLPGSGPGA
ncbi:MAG: cell division protein ZapA [Pseudomonadota bacterium]